MSLECTTDSLHPSDEVQNPLAFKVLTTAITDPSHLLLVLPLLHLTSFPQVASFQASVPLLRLLPPPVMPFPFPPPSQFLLTLYFL